MADRFTKIRHTEIGVRCKVTYNDEDYHVQYRLMVSYNVVLGGYSCSCFGNGDFEEIYYSNTETDMYFCIRGDFLKFIISRCSVDGSYDPALLVGVVEDIVASTTFDFTYDDVIYTTKCDFYDGDCDHPSCCDETYDIISEIPESLLMSHVKSARK